MKQCFLSYSHDDRSTFEDFRIHISPIEPTLGIKIWCDDRLEPGDRWHDEISHEIEKSEIFILMFSPRYLASRYIQSQELPRIMQRQERDESVLALPVIVEKCIWQPFVNQMIQPVPICSQRRPRAIRDWRPQRDGFYEASAQIITALNSWLGADIDFTESISVPE